MWEPATPGRSLGVTVPTKVTLVCLLSSPHSGSTILGATLAAHPEVVYAGELFEIPVPAWTPGRPCACGRSAPECPFWSAVRPRVEAGGSLDRFAAEEHRFDRWPALPRWWLGHRRPSRSVLSY
ncbi:sulfotransferase domain-containing protein, partial [mine drainage metagenome]